MSESQTIDENLLQDENFSRLRQIFGEQSSVKKEISGYEIKTRLEDGISEGGQEIEIHTTFSRTVKKESLKFPIKAYKLTSLKINGIDTTKNFANIFFEIRGKNSKEYEREATQTETVDYLIKNKTGHKLLDHIMEVRGTLNVYRITPRNIKKINIFLTTFKVSDDLESLFHEQGHINNTSEQTRGIAKLIDNYWQDAQTIGMWTANVSRNLPDSIKQNIVLNRWKKVIKLEVSANKEAIKLVYKLSNKMAIFPEDIKTNLMRFKKAQDLALQSYLQDGNGWYLNQISADELTKLTSLD